MKIDRADTKKDTWNERIDVLYNEEIVVNTYLQALHNELNEALIDAKNRGIRLRFITEITRDNVSTTY